MIEVRQRLPPLKKVSFRQDAFSLKGKGDGLAERRSRVRSSRNTLRRSLVLLFGSAAILAVGLGHIEPSWRSSSETQSNVRKSRRLLNLARSSSVALDENPIKVVSLSETTRDAINEDIISLRVNTFDILELQAFIESSKAIVKKHLSQELLTVLSTLNDRDSPTSAVLFRNIPVDPLVPPTPTDGSKSLGKDTFVAEAMLVGLGELSHSMIVGYSSETQYSNPWIHEGFPRNSPGSALTKASDLSFHQDMSYHKAAPDILGLVCVREGHDRHVNTELVDNREVFSLLPSDVLETLKQPRFAIKTSGWVESSQLKTAESSRPLVSERGAIHLPVDWDNMVGLDKEAQHAVELLKRAIDQAPKHDVHFVPGDLLFFSNQRTIHSRTPYTDLRFDGGDRVLIRAYFLSEMTADQRRTRIL